MDWIVRGMEYVEKERKTTTFVKDANISNANTLLEVLPRNGNLTLNVCLKACGVGVFMETLK